ncbi:PepSY domain-containing protein [Parendozoicomonas haliclonae]|uniref:Peptidase propeptide and YPEB domain protein n=1 Tax=Parendozoicomonas haliclonae TaxID=1960125 RepID=A0A1X7AGK1_9GAMM|nr:PepSY domain-containing protein [Parendozoicomonas haliclonae]SMA39372.1 Peptidase propeptide and YPEB domain protein [Parendozoicomonas haliclonae]
MKDRLLAVVQALFVTLAVACMSAVPAWSDEDKGELYNAMVGAGKSGRMVAEQLLKNYPGFLISFDAEVNQGKLFYDYEILQISAQKVLDVEVDAATGTVTKQKSKPLERELPATKQELSGLVTLLDAWKMAESKFGRYVTEIELDEEQGQYVYETEVLNHDRKGKVVIDGKTGQPLPVGRIKPKKQHH